MIACLEQTTFDSTRNLGTSLAMITVIVLDFDGVTIRTSEFFKQEAWPLVLAHYGGRAMELFAEAEEKYGEGRGGDRYDILLIFEKLAEPTDKIPSLVQAGAVAFNAHVQERITEIGVELSERKALEHLSARYALYVNSGTPQKELRQTITRLKLDAVFKAVPGRPSSKLQNLRLVLQSENAKPANILFVGDGEHDHKAALELGCHFVGYSNEWNKWTDRDKQFPLVSSLRDVIKYVEAM
jgi:phosphoglycolate phosphatase